MPIAEPAAFAPLLSDSTAELYARRSLRRSLKRRVQASGARIRRRRSRTAGVALVGAMTLAGGVAAAQEQVGGASSQARSVRTASTTLRPGSSGSAVTALQRKLHVKADGAYGPRTWRAVRRQQRKRHMKADGIARPSVLRVLGVDMRAAASNPRVHPVLQRIAKCESGGNPRAVSGSGRYRGKYQFSFSTWRNMGGKGDPAKASEARQDKLAAKLFASHGRAPWPHCGARA